MKVKMNQLVKWSTGDIASPRQMIDEGKAIVRKVDKFQATSRGKPRKATFVDIIGTTSGVEVSGYVNK